jgi:hypothetical protein
MLIVYKVDVNKFIRKYTSIYSQSDTLETVSMYYICDT